MTTLTKRMAEDLTDYLTEHGVKVRYLHSDIDTLERIEIIRALRADGVTGLGFVSTTGSEGGGSASGRRAR